MKETANRIRVPGGRIMKAAAFLLLFSASAILLLSCGKTPDYQNLQKPERMLAYWDGQECELTSKDKEYEEIYQLVKKCWEAGKDGGKKLNMAQMIRLDSPPADRSRLVFVYDTPVSWRITPDNAESEAAMNTYIFFLNWEEEMAVICRDGQYEDRAFLPEVKIDGAKVREILEKKASSDNPEAGWGEGVYLKTASDPMIYLKNSGPCCMYGLTDEMKAVLEPLETGDIIEVRFDFIQETYPGSISPCGLRFLRKGSNQDVPGEEIQNLQKMGYHIISADSPSGLPDFEIRLRWGAYGYSHYDSASGELVKTTDAANPEDYKTTHFLTDEEKEIIWAALVDMNYEIYPGNYRPNPNADSEPPSILELTVTIEDQSHTTRTRDGYFYAIEDPGVKNAADNFIKNFDKIAVLLMNTPEWQALPDYEHYYE